LAQRDEKKDVSLTYSNRMPKLKSKAVRASFQRRYGSAHFVSSKNLASDNDFSSDGQNQFVLNLIGDDELCETSDDNIGVDIVNDLIDGDAAILNDINDSEPISTESILEAWRSSVSRQHDPFVRRGESKRSKQRHDKDHKDLKAISKEIPKINTFFVSATSSSSSSSQSSSGSMYEELSMDEIMRGINIEEAEDTFAETTEVIREALVKIEADSNFSIPQSQHADKKLSAISKYEYTQRQCIKSYLNFRVHHDMGKMDASVAVASVIFNKSPFKKTYRARVIREWAAYYLYYGNLKPFRRGKFVKTFTIISNEAVQNVIRSKIRDLKPIQRSPLNIMNMLNTEWLREIPQVVTVFGIWMATSLD